MMDIPKILILILLMTMLTSCSAKTTKLNGCFPCKGNEINSTDQTNLELGSVVEKKEEILIFKKDRPQNHYLMDSSRVIEVKVSEKGYTRLFLENERVVDVFCYPEENFKIHIQDEGFVLIVPSLIEGAVPEEGSKYMERTYLTIVGESGTTQDLVVFLTGKNPEPVKLINSNPEKFKEI